MIKGIASNNFTRRSIFALPYSSAEKRKTSSLFTWVLLGLAGYQFLLCFINTNLVTVSNSAVAATEITLLIVMAIKIFGSVNLVEAGYFLISICYFSLLWVSRGEIDAAEPRDIAVIFFAYAFGRLINSREEVNKIIWTVSTVVMLVGGIEFFFTKLYLHYFDILHYYIARGQVSGNVPIWVKQNTFVSGLRTGGRNLFPILGELRVSSIFLEPVSLGNYAIILAIWSLSHEWRERRRALGHLVAAVVLIVASDSRFASLLVIALCVVRITFVLQRRGILLVMPCVATGSLMIIANFRLGDFTQDNFSGRLARTGQALLDMSLSQLTGFGVPDPLPDMGIAYAIEHFGLLMCVALWLTFIVPARENAYAIRIKAMLAVYALAILTISGTSFFSAKTAALAWFIYGSSSAYLIKPKLQTRFQTMIGRRSKDQWPELSEKASI